MSSQLNVGALVLVWRETEIVRVCFRKILVIVYVLICVLVPQESWSADNDTVINVGVPKNFPPIYLINAETEAPTGFAIDVIEHISKSADLVLKYRIYDTWANLNAALRAGEVDLIPNLGITDERRSFANFTDPVHTFAVSLFIRDEERNISSADELAGSRVSVVQDNVGQRLMKSHPDNLLIVHNDPEQALLALLSGKTDAVVYPEPILLQIAREAGLAEQIRTVGKPLIEIKRAIAVRKDLPNLSSKLSPIVTEFVGTPAYQAILTKWYGEAESYWTAERVGVWMGVLLALSLAGSFAWRYWSMRQINEQLRLQTNVLESVDVGIVITDARQNDNPIIFANAGIERMAGYKASEMIGRNCRFLQGEDRDQEGRHVLREAVEAGEAAGVTLRNYRKDGAQFLDEVNIFPVRDGAGALTHYIGIQRDVTDRIGIENQLKQMQKMDSIGRLTGGVAHDFNNLLTVIIGNLELLDGKIAADTAATELLNEAVDAAEMGSQLSHRLLAFSRQQVLEPKVVNLNDIVVSMQNMLRRTLGEPIEISIILAQDLGDTRVDPGQVESAILNLAINARDAMPSGGHLTIKTASQEIDEGSVNTVLGLGLGRYVTVSVTDTGDGMTPEVKDKIFDPFFTTKDVGKGTGLGLSMVYGFVKQSGGHVVADSELGSGTTVTILLPQETSEMATSESANPSSSRAAEESNQTILVVEDDARVRRVTVKRLQTLGYEVLEAEDGPTALTVLDKVESVDLLLTDYVMPGGMSGADLAQKVGEAYPDMKIMFTSGYAETERELESGITWLRKPYKIPTLAQKLQEVLPPK